MKAGTLQNSCSAPFVLVTILVSNFTVVVLVGGAAEHPASSPELQDLQQQQTGHGGQALLEQEAVPQQEEQLVHPLAVHLLQLLSDAVQLQHQAVHLQREVEEVSVTLLSLVSLVYFILKAIFLACTFKKKTVCSFSPPPHSLEHLVGPALSDSQTQDGPEPPLACCSPT